MTSQINPNNIDGNYPVAGQPNNTQGMRDNFTNTKTNFQYAEDEINDLQSKVILKSALTGGVVDNNMNDTLLYAVQLSDVSYKEIQLTATSGTVTLDYEAAMYQAMPSVSGNVSLAFTNWPVSGQVGALRFAMVVSNTAYTLTLPASVNVGLTQIDGISPGTAGVTNTVTFASVGVYVFEFLTSNAGTNISISANIRPSNTYSNVIDITNTTPSTSKTTGALIVAGGIGVGANLNVGGDFTTYNTSNSIVFSVSASTGFTHINAPTVPANSAGALNIVGSTSGSYQPIVNPGGMLHITGNDGMASRLSNDSFGDGANNVPLIQQRRSRGTAALPTAVQSGDILARYIGSGWGTTGYALNSGVAPTSIEFVARENFTDSASGSKIEIYTANIGAVTRTLSANITSTLTTVPALSAVGNITAGNVTTSGLMSTTGNVNAGNIIGSASISCVGNISTTGNLLLNDGGTMGYNSGSGGTVSQSGNKSSGVTLNKPAGEITMQNTNLASDTTVQFTLTNSTISAKDLLLINIVGGAATGAAYNLDANCSAGSAVISVRNITGGTLGEALVLRYVVIRGSTA